MDELLKRHEAIPGQVLHHGETDPNLYIYNAHLEKGDTEKAAKFLEYRKKWEKARTSDDLSPHPLEVAFAFQNSYNLACPHCYRQFNETKDPRNSLPYDEIIRLIDECKEIGVHSIQLGAGIESFQYPKINDIIQYIGAKGFEDFWVSTNGQLMDEEKSKLLLDSNVTRIPVSMDAISPQTYAKSRGGSYYRLMKNIFQFLELREKRNQKLPILRVSFVRYNLTEHETEDFIRFWKKIANEVDVQPLIDVRNVNELRYDTIEPEKISCRYPTNMMWIDWNGDYRPCCTDFSKLVKVGNVKDGSILKAWHGENINDLRAQLSRKKKLNRACVNCLRSMNSSETYEPLTKGRKKSA